MSVIRSSLRTVHSPQVELSSRNPDLVVKGCAGGTRQGAHGSIVGILISSSTRCGVCGVIWSQCTLGQDVYFRGN